MNRRSQAQAPREQPIFDLPVVPLRPRRDRVLSFAETVETALREPAPLKAFFSGAALDGMYLVASALAELHPVYVVALIEEDGRVVFKETLRFVWMGKDGRAEARPDSDTAKRLARLGKLLSDQIVYVPDELSSELDGVRDPLCQAWRVQSVAPLLAGKVREAGEAAKQELLAAVIQGFDEAPDPAARARFMRKARQWSAADGFPAP